MKFEELVASCETCVRMRDAGYPQGGALAVWRDTETRKPWLSRGQNRYVPCGAGMAAAPTFAEIAERLPASSQFDKLGSAYCARADHGRAAGNNVAYSEASHAEAAALLWLALNEAR